MAPPRPLLLLLLLSIASPALPASVPGRASLNALPRDSPKSGLKLPPKDAQTPEDAWEDADPAVAALSASYDRAVSSLLDPLLDDAPPSPALLAAIHSAPSALLHPALRPALLSLLTADCNATAADHHKLRRALQHKDACLRQALSRPPPPASPLPALSGRETLLEAALCHAAPSALRCAAPALEAAAACSGRAGATAALLAALQALAADYCQAGGSRLVEGLRATDQTACLAQGVGFLLRQVSPNALYSQSVALLPHRSALCQYVTYVAKVSNFHLRYFCGAAGVGAAIDRAANAFLAAADCPPAVLWTPTMFS